MPACAQTLCPARPQKGLDSDPADNGIFAIEFDDDGLRSDDDDA